MSHPIPSLSHRPGMNIANSPEFNTGLRGAL